MGSLTSSPLSRFAHRESGQGGEDVKTCFIICSSCDWGSGAVFPIDCARLCGHVHRNHRLEPFRGAFRFLEWLTSCSASKPRPFYDCDHRPGHVFHRTLIPGRFDVAAPSDTPSGSYGQNIRGWTIASPLPPLLLIHQEACLPHRKDVSLERPVYSGKNSIKSFKARFQCGLL